MSDTKLIPPYCRIDPQARQRWMAVLAKASPEELEKDWGELGNRPPYRYLRPPEIGLIMVCGRAGGTGTSFNLGEMALTRCTVQLENGVAGCGYVIGRSPRHAELAALFDALLQDASWHESILKGVILPLQDEAEKKKVQERDKTATTRVEFFTMVRGE
jgi:alpha-D-ribose 1-methylphosphonate 5-triphosphate synthase subunit PhnG